MTKHFALVVYISGLPNYLEIIKLVFQYLLIQFRGSDHAERHRIRDEMAHIEEVNFRYRSKVREDQHTEQLACNLTRYSAEDCICGPDLFFEKPDMSVIDSIIDTYFQPSNMRVHLIAPEAEQPGLEASRSAFNDDSALKIKLFAKDCVSCRQSDRSKSDWATFCDPGIPVGAKWEEEFWYKSKYFSAAVDDKLAQTWVDKNQTCHAGLHLPPPNPVSDGSLH